MMTFSHVSLNLVQDNLTWAASHFILYLASDSGGYVSAPLDLKLPHSPSHPTVQLLYLISPTIALPDTLPAPAAYLVDDVCRALYSPQSVSHGMP